METENTSKNLQVIVEDNMPKFDKATKLVITKNALYVLGAILICVSIYYLANDMRLYHGDTYTPRQYDVRTYTYVGGDAFNYIITVICAVRVMLKALVFAVLGSTSLLLARLTP